MLTKPNSQALLNAIVTIGVAIASLWHADQAPAQPAAQSQGSSVLNELESENTPIQKANGQVETDIKPRDVIHWTLAGYEFDATTHKMTATLSLATEKQFTIYQDKLKLETASGWTVVSKTAPKTTLQYDPISRKEVQVYTGGPFNLVMELTGPAEEAAIQITYVGCTKVICLFPHKEKISLPWTPSTAGPPAKVGSAPAVSAAASIPSVTQPSVAQPSVAQPSVAQPSGTVEEQFARKVKAGQMTLATLLLIAFAGGLLTNLTPCVAPMIPITIRLLAHQTVKPLTSAAMYALGIVVTYTSLGVVAALSGALFGNLIAHPAVSITFGIVMFVLGLNMLGFGDLSRLQQIGGRIGSANGGVWNSFLMGAGAGLVASPCTGPILAALLTYTAGRQNTLEAIALLGVYSTGFALPYVVLGASAARISKMRVSFHVQILTKLVFASVMFALSLYFMRLPLYGLFTFLRPYWGYIGTIGLISGLAFSALIILKQSLHHQKAVYLAPTLTLGIGMFFGIQSLMRDGKPANAIQWIHSEKEAVEAATKSGKPIIADAWAEWCEACKKMDITTFAEADVIAEISEHWTPLKFDLTEVNDENNGVQERYELPGLPTLTLMPPTGDLKSKVAITGYASSTALLEQLRKSHGTLSGQPAK